MMLRSLLFILLRSVIDSRDIPVSENASIQKRLQILESLRDHGTAVTLDLSEANLEGAVLDGLNLDGVKLGDYSKRCGAKLARASFLGTSMRGAILCFADLSGAKMRRADLTQADLAYAILDEADLRGTTLVEADLYKTNLAHTNLSQADLTNADLYLARLDTTWFARADLHPPLLHENNEAYSAFLERLSERRGRPMSTLSPPLERAFEIYQALKTNWRTIGRVDDASWAYVRERRAERAMHAPWRAARYFRQELPPAGTKCRFIALPTFYLHHTLTWILLWCADLTSGFGEHPLQTIIVALVVILIFPFLYRASGGVVAVHHSSRLDYLIYSLASFSTIGFENFRTTNWQAELLTSIEALAGIALLALLMFSLGNRISRL